jgi:hypothetical protein
MKTTNIVLHAFWRYLIIFSLFIEKKGTVNVTSFVYTIPYFLFCIIRYCCKKSRARRVLDTSFSCKEPRTKVDGGNTIQTQCKRLHVASQNNLQLYVLIICERSEPSMHNQGTNKDSRIQHQAQLRRLHRMGIAAEAELSSTGAWKWTRSSIGSVELYKTCMFRFSM